MPKQKQKLKITNLPSHICVLDLSADIDLWPLFDKNEVKVRKENKTGVICKQTAGKLKTDIKMNEMKT